MNKKLWILIVVLAAFLVVGTFSGCKGDTTPTTAPAGIETSGQNDPTGGDDDDGTTPTVPGGSESTKPEATTPSGGTESGSTDNPGNTGNGGNTGSGEPTGPEISVDDGAEPSVGSDGVIEFQDLLDAAKNGEGQN